MTNRLGPKDNFPAQQGLDRPDADRRLPHGGTKLYRLLHRYERDPIIVELRVGVGGVHTVEDLLRWLQTRPRVSDEIVIVDGAREVCRFPVEHELGPSTLERTWEKIRTKQRGINKTHAEMADDAVAAWCAEEFG